MKHLGSPRAAKVLVVDDYADVVRTMCAILNLDGHDCTPALSGEEALERCSSGHYDCMLLDYQMGAVTGLDVVQHLSTTPADRPTRIVMLSAQSPELFSPAMDCGFIDAILSKPADVSDVLAQVSRSVR